MKSLIWRTVIVAALVVAAVVYLLPTLVPGMWPHKKINLGLDLRGGMHLVMEVDTAKAVESMMDRMVEELRDQMRASDLRYDKLERRSDNKILVRVPEANRDAFNKILDEEFQHLRLASQDTEGEWRAYTLDLPDTEVANVKKMAAEQALETVRNRVDQFGVSEPDIRPQGENRILIQLPGVKDTQRAKELIGRTALLEFKLVDDAIDAETAIRNGVPAGTEVLYEVQVNQETNRETKTPFVLKKRAVLTGAYLTDARVQIDSQYGEPHVSIKFDQKGARIFERVTGENVKKRLAIVLDDKVFSAPVIQEKIGGGEARITGNFTMEEAKDLAIVLRAGALPAPVNILEERTVGPSLGADSIHQGMVAMLVGGIAVVLFMILYYKAAGFVADLALVLNILFILAAMAALQATLTLPGIAGMVLTIGMAVDANVLIYERIREELRLGKSQHAALAAGYERATLTILDANVTTLIAALVLFQFGTGPVKGFAVTLSLGVVSSVFTALYVTRIIFDAMLLKLRVKRLSI